VALQSLQREIQTRLHERMVGAHEEVLVDSISRRRDGELSGRTGGNVVVSFQSRLRDVRSRIGELVRVEIEAAGPHSLRGREVTGGGSSC
jgi:tRNA-2-methylthio-N6-dimethylallyladenosine synthase